MNVTRNIIVSTALVAVMVTPGGAWAQEGQLPANSPFRGGVPDGLATPDTLPLSVAEVIKRALEHNLGVLTSEDAVEHARGSRRLALADLLPNVGASLRESRQTVNLEAFGFPLQGTGFPALVGPFNVFDARVFLSQTVFDASAMRDARAETHGVAAARHSYQSARDLVVLVAANLYLQTVSADARAQSARAQRDTAQALFDQAGSLRQAGVVAGIDVIRAEVRLATERQNVTSAENQYQKSKLQLARVIGLPIGQAFNLSETVPFVPAPTMALPDVIERAYRERPDYLAALDRVREAEARRKAASGEALPAVRVNADYGAIGLTPGNARSTFTVAGTVVVPIFDGGRRQGRVLETDADLRSRRAEAENLRSEIDYDVRISFLDLQATGEQLQVATRARELAAQQLTQSRDRFAAGVTNNVEVVQAQEAVALASEQYIGALYAFNVAKAVLARSMGTAEQTVQQFLSGQGGVQR
ncbi:MAG: TolC family protein [Vicinamibacterales bacterium]